MIKYVYKRTNLFACSYLNSTVTTNYNEPDRKVSSKQTCDCCNNTVIVGKQCVSK